MKTRFTILSLLLAQFVYSQPTFIKDSLDQYVARAMRDWKIPGVAVGVVKDGKVVLARGFGVTEVGGSKVDANTLFMIGSNTKAFTATALAMLEADGKMSLDDRVQKWLPDFKLYDPLAAKEATVRDLLCHRLGFETFQGDFMFFDTDLTSAQVLERFGRLKPLYSLRSRWGYTNAAFLAAGEVVRSVSGQTWENYLTEKMFKPLGMNSTIALSKNITTSNNRASAHTVDNDQLKKIPYGNIDGLAPAGSISSSVNDMLRWVSAQLDTGKLDGSRVIAKNAIMRTREPSSILGNGRHPFNRINFMLYGLGWFLEDYAGKKGISHTGGVNGFVTSVYLLPEERLGIIVLTNTDTNNFYESLRNEILDAYLNLPYRDYSGKAFIRNRNYETSRTKELKAKRDTIAMKLKPVLPLNALGGNYSNELYGRMIILMEAGVFVARFEHHPDRFATLESLGGNRLLATFNEALFGVKVWPFTIENGKVKSITVRVADFVEFTPYEFVKVN